MATKNNNNIQNVYPPNAFLSPLSSEDAVILNDAKSIKIKIPVKTKLPIHEKNPAKNALNGNVPTIAQ